LVPLPDAASNRRATSFSDAGSGVTTEQHDDERKFGR
jgi:hypothetical protein